MRWGGNGCTFSLMPFCSFWAARRRSIGVGAAQHPSGCELVSLLRRIDFRPPGNLPSADLQRQHVS